MLRNSGLGIVEVFYQILVAHQNHGPVCLHYITEDFYSRRVSQSVRYFGDQQYLILLYIVRIFSLIS